MLRGTNVSFVRSSKVTNGIGNHEWPLESHCNPEGRSPEGLQWRFRGHKWLPINHLYHVALRFDEFFHEIFKPPQITNGNLIIAVLLVESNTMVFVRSSKVTNGWLVTICDPESVIVTLQGYALQGYNGFLGVTHGYQSTIGHFWGPYKWYIVLNSDKNAVKVDKLRCGWKWSLTTWKSG